MGMKMFVTVLHLISATNMDLIKLKRFKIHTHTWKSLILADLYI
jgi:hypothetical protein